MGLSREFITAATECPKCGALKTELCVNSSGNARSKNHFERMHKAQIEYPELAMAWKEEYNEYSA